MANVSDMPRHAAHAARREVSEHRDWVHWMARAGWAAKGIVFVLVGVIAAQAAFGAGDQAQGSSGALTTLADETWGRLLLGLIGVGLAAYAIWSFIKAAMNPERLGSDWKGIAKRVVDVIRGVLYALLAVEAVRLALGSGGGEAGGSGPGGAGGGQSQAEHWTAQVMQWPAGRWIVIAAGLLILGYGVYQLVRAWKGHIEDKLNVSGLPRGARHAVITGSRFGIGARGVVFMVIGGLVAAAGWQTQAQQAAGLGEALRTLEQSSYGPWVLGVIALGLIAYGLYEMLRAEYGRIHPV